MEGIGGNPAVVFDNGTNMFRGGFSGEDAPRVIFPTVVGRSTGAKVANQRNLFVGDEVYINKNKLDIAYPVRDGLITNWDDMEHVFRHCYELELVAFPENQPVIVTEAALNPKPQREKMTQLFFEKFGVPSFYLAITGNLPIYASGRIEGLTVDIGASSTQVFPIPKGDIYEKGIVKTPLGGDKLTEYLYSNLKELLGPKPTGTLLTEEIKEKLGRVSENYDAELHQIKEGPLITYKLPDGKTIALGTEIITCPEVLFQPNLLNLEWDGVPKLINDSIMACEEDKRKNLFANIVLTGGTTLFHGFQARLETELKKLNPSYEMKIFAPPERKYTNWIGASILSSLPFFDIMWITKKEYDEYGPSIVHKKCPSGKILQHLCFIFTHS